MPSQAEIATDDILAGGGEMGALMRSIDWSKTAVGAVERWPQSLRTALSILLETGFPMYIAWGPGFTQFYNDGYRPILGSTKHPVAMGIGTRETFAEIWHIIGPMFEGVMAGTPVTLHDFMLPLDRHGFVEECYFDFSYSPIRKETGDVGGVLVTCSETTERVLAARRLETLRALAAKTQKASDARSTYALAASALGENPADLPFALLYTFETADGRAALAAASGTPPTPPEGATDVGEADVGWLPPDVWTSREPRTIDLPRNFSAPAETSARALALPIRTPGAASASGVLVAGLSRRLLLNDAYRDFLGLVAAQLGSAIASARALAEAKARADALAELDRAKTTFIANISHEFRTPLTLMLGPAEDALNAGDALPPDDRDRWQLVQRSGRRLLKLVNALLDFARIEAGRVDACYEPTDLTALTAELVSMFRSAIERAGISLRTELPPREEPAFVDREMWEKIVINLLSNALKFTFQGEISVALRVVGDAFQLVVRDTGIGIADADLPNVFARFHRVKGARARTHEGTGIGLALVAELAKLHGGGATVSSAEGRGTTFTVSVPRGKSHLPVDRIGAPRSPTATRTGADPLIAEALRWTHDDAEAGRRDTGRAPVAGARARIVLADDNADMRDYVSRLVRERWDVTAVADGAEALDEIRRNPPDIVLADVMMPGLDGFALLRAIRDDAILRTTPVILLSARAGEESTAEGLNAGANDYIVKPFSARDLLVRIASHLATAKAAREAHAIEAEARQRLYAHFMQAPFPVAVLRGPKHVLELANPIALRAWGKADDILGRPLLAALPELRGQPFERYVDDVYRTGVAYEGRGELARLARGPGDAIEDVYFDFVYAPLRGANGPVEGILVCGFEVTSQVLAQKQLANALTELESKERHFRELVENLPELAWTARPDGHLDYYNRRWYEFTGTTFEQMEGWGWRAVHDPARLDTVVDQWKRSIDTGEPFEMEFPLRGADGVFRWFLTRVVPLRDADGNIVRWFGTNTKIDEQRRARKTAAFLAEVGAALATTLDYDTALSKLTELSVPSFADFCILDVLEGPELRRVSVAASGLDRERALFALRDRFPLRVDSSQPAAVAYRTGQSFTLTFADDAALAATCQDAAHFELLRRIGPRSVIASPIVIGGKVDGAMTFGFCMEAEPDVQRVALAEELARRAAATIENARLYRSALATDAQKSAILNAALDSIVVMDDADRICDFNPAAERTFGHRREDVLGKPMSQLLIPPAYRQAHRAGVARYLATGEGPIFNRRLELTALRADGTEFPVELAVVPLRSGTEVRFTAYMRDISERRRAESERAKLLEKEQAAREEAERSNRAKDEFLAIVSHELRNPLSSMLGWTRLLRAGDLAETVRDRALETIERNAVNQSQLIEDLLDVSRIVSGKLRLDIQQVDLASIVESALDSARPAIAAKQIILKRDIDLGTFALAGDPTRLQQIAWNLLSNATKFTPRGGTIQVVLRRVESTVALTVIDDGQGIAPEFLPLVFERFKQADSSSTRAHGGLGLGLAISKSLVEMHGGTIEALSDGLGKGAAFVVRLPVRALVAADRDASSKASRADGRVEFECPPELRGTRVLIVDDEEDARDLLSTVLVQCGAIVVTASSVANAFAILERSPQDVLVTDIGMPDEDGYGLIRKVRALPRERGGNVPAACLTAYAGPEDRRRALQAGFNMHVPKPVEPAELVAVVASLARIAKAIR